MANLDSRQHYGKLYPSYWDGATGARILETGGVDAFCLGAYLVSNRLANAIGLYWLPFPSIRIGLDAPRMVAAFDALDRSAFATYDYGTEFVWVREMARVRMGLENRNASLSKTDKRLVTITRQYEYANRTPFVWAFFQRYRKSFPSLSGRKPVVSLKKHPLSLSLSNVNSCLQTDSRQQTAGS